LLDGRTFEEFHIDVGIGDPVIDPIDLLEGPSLLDFAGIQSTILPCYPVTQQISEKFHAYTRPHVSGESSRVKDFVDILLLAKLGKIDANRLYLAIQATFDFQKTHVLPIEHSRNRSMTMGVENKPGIITWQKVRGCLFAPQNRCQGNLVEQVRRGVNRSGDRLGGEG
jgi:hypothetical protein